MPKVSICIPAYNQVEYLRKTLRSVIEQTFTDYEVIISDDSTDNAVENLLKEFNFKNKLTYFRNAPALGSPANWNASILKAKGEFIKILHHDDFFIGPESLRKFVGLLENNPKASFAFSGTEINLLKLKTKKLHTCSDKKLSAIKRSPEMLFFANYIGAPSATIFRKKDLILFDIKMKWLVDVDWYIQMIKNNSHIVHTKEALICTIHGATGQVTQSVISDKQTQISEHVYLYSKLAKSDPDPNKFSIFFQILFNKYNIQNIDDLKAIVDVPQKLTPFFIESIQLKDKNSFPKKVNYWLRKNSFNDHLFTLKTMFK